VADANLDHLARLIGELGQVLARLRTRELTATAPRSCAKCGRHEQPWTPVLDPGGRITGWVGPSCARKGATGGVQLPLEQEGAPT